ncbi:unnamed protein product [Auanema sp. JU1783]|nr:unnamed protein product [Auanema sp. JU1783]
MDLEWWNCRNLARIVLSRAFREAILHLSEDSSCCSEDTTQTTDEDLPNKSVRLDEFPKVAYYNRFNHLIPNKDEPTTIYHIPTYLADVPNDLLDVRWPISASMTPLIGKRAIIDFIEKKWKYNPRIHYVVDFLCLVYLNGSNKYKYCSRWSNGYASSRVYFTLDASLTEPSKPVTMKFFLPDGKRAHRPSTSEEHFDKFIRYLNTQKHNNYINKN